LKPNARSRKGTVFVQVIKATTLRKKSDLRMNEGTNMKGDFVDAY